MENFKDKLIQYRQPLLAGFIILQIIFIAGVMLSVHQVTQGDYISDDDLTKQPQIMIDGLADKIPGLFPENVYVIQQSLFDIVKENIPEVNTDIEAIIRDNTIKTHYFESQDIESVSAIIDIPDLRQSYQVFHEYSKTENNQYLTPNGSVIVLCLADQSEIIYPEFKCKDVYDQKTRYGIVANYMNYFRFEYFSAYAGQGDQYQTIYISPVDPTIDESTKKKYIQETKSAIDLLGISPELFKYHILTFEELDYTIQLDDQ